MKQLIASIGNQPLNQTVAALLATLYVFMRKALRATAYFIGVFLVTFFMVCAWVGAKEFFRRLPTSIEIIKTFF